MVRGDRDRRTAHRPPNAATSGHGRSGRGSANCGPTSGCGRRTSRSRTIFPTASSHVARSRAPTTTTIARQLWDLPRIDGESRLRRADLDRAAEQLERDGRDGLARGVRRAGARAAPAPRRAAAPGRTPPADGRRRTAGPLRRCRAARSATNCRRSSAADRTDAATWLGRRGNQYRRAVSWRR